MTNNAPITTIKLTQIKQYYFPVDAESYKILREANFPSLRFHQNMAPIVRLICSKAKIQAKVIPFKQSILDPFLDKAGTLWQAKPYRKATITSNTMIFMSSKELEHSKKALEQLEISLRRFFDRWGYSCTFSYSNTKVKCKLHVTYRFSTDKLPILPLSEDNTVELPTFRFKVGFIRFSFKLGIRQIETIIEQQAGSEWKYMQSSKCLYSQIGDVRPMLSVLSEFMNKDEHNFDNTNT